jgi:hypothetical protein
MFFENEFIFTQAAALANFSQISKDLRSTVTHVTLRVVGKYYDNEPSKRNVLGAHYHSAIPNFPIPIHGRPKGAEMDRGMHSYCWQQFADFLLNIQIPSPRGSRLSKLFPKLTRMRVDLVNFSQHLHFPASSFSTVLRWHAGPFLEELIVTGLPEDDPDDGPEQLFSRVVKDEGVFASGAPIMVSLSKGVKTLPLRGLVVKVVRADSIAKDMRRHMRREHNIKIQKALGPVDPDGSLPPKSQYPPERIIWKFTQDSLATPERKWIEFDRQSGYPAEDME